MTGSLWHEDLHDNERETRMHAEAIRHILLRHRDIPAEKVTRLYEIVLRRYKAGARVKDFLTLLAARRVEELLQKWSSLISKGT